jgi:oligopeptidase B
MFVLPALVVSSLFSPEGFVTHALAFRMVQALPWVISAVVLAAADNATLPAPPVAKKVPHVTEVNGHQMVDNYFWLREKTNPEVRAYLEAENAYTDAVMKPTAAFQTKLYGEMLGRVKETDVEVPYREGDYFYYVREEAGKQYPIRCRKKALVSDAPEEIVLDQNELAKGQPFMAIAAYAVSPDGNLLAYSYDDTGFRQYQLAVKDLRTGKTLTDHAERVGSVVWANDSQTIFYTQEDPVEKRQFRLYRHTVASPDADALVYEEKDEKFVVSAFKSRSSEYIFLVSGSHTTSEARYIAAKDPTADWKVIEPRKQGVEYYPDHNGDSFYIRVNDTGRNFRLVRTPVTEPSSNNWQEVLPQNPDIMIDEVDFFRNFCVLYEREQGLPQIRVTDLRNGQSKKIDFPEPAYASYPYVNRVYDTSELRYGYQSPMTPPSVYSYDMDKGTSTLLKQKEVPNYDKNKYQVAQVYATASDGVKVPISILYAKDTKLDGKAGLYLYGYGSYGISIDSFFNPNIFSMVDRGVVTAVAHIRGGGEMGKAWHDAGRMMNKKTTFTDFIACAEFLVKNDYGSKDRLVIEGRSAGGLLMGAVLNMRPDLFHAALVGVPFVDVMNTMLDESLPLTVGEFEEWGNPKEKAAFDYMITYSPYDNVAAKNYPDMLVKTSFNDSQVMYWEPAKYVAKMRATRTDHNILLLKTNLQPAGHGGASGRYDRLHESAFDYAWILGEMGITN